MLALILLQRGQFAGDRRVTLHHLFRQIVAINLQPFTQIHHALDQILQLAHVAGPVPRLQTAHCLGGELRRDALQPGAERLNEGIHQAGNILLTLAQRRDLQRNHIQAIVEVAAERAFFHRIQQIAVGSGDDAHVDLDGMGRADSHHFALLQHAQQAGLRLERHLANLIKEQGAAIGQLKFARRAAASRSGKSAVDIAKQFALH